MSFADKLAALNEWHFFKEFTYSKTTFCPQASQQVELADAIIWIGDLLVIYQIKEREPQRNTTAEDERRWFEKKVLGKATRQVRDTLAYLRNVGTIEVRNHRGHVFRLDFNSIRQMHKVVVYLPSATLPANCAQLKHHRSQTAGIIHVMNATSYLGMVRTLLTPAEVVDYLAFREQAINQYENEVAAIPEEALVGQYLSGAQNTAPSAQFVEHVRLLDHRADEWDMSGIIEKFPDGTKLETETHYYPIVRELALLKRGELREFKSRFQLALVNARANAFARPYRMAIPRTGCGFIFVPLTKETIPVRTKGLQNFAFAHKYEIKLSKCVGVSIADDVEGYFGAEWLYLEFPWEHHPAMEAALKENNPFRPIREAELPSYAFKRPN